jgi:hypothetical protein
MSMQARWLAVVLILGGGAANAASPTPPARAPAVQAVADCRKIAADAERLACYDTAVGAMVEAEDKGDLVSIDRAQRRTVRREAFGFTLPSLSIFDRGEKPDELNRVTETVASAFQNAEGKWVLRMQDGAVWRQIDGNDLGRTPRAGATAVISKAIMGSFMMDLDGYPGIRVHRDN